MLNSWSLNQYLLAFAVNNAVDNKSIITVYIIFSLFILISFRKSVGDKPLSILQTNQIKGLAILIIIFHHVSLTLGKTGYLLLFSYLGFPSVSVFLILSGYGIFLSIEKKGLNNFFSKRVIRIYIPFVLAMISKVLIFDYFVLNTRNHVGSSLLNIFLSPTKVDLYMWFIIYILFWYCITYIILSLNKLNKYQIFYLFLTGMLVCISQAPRTWLLNSFSFPFGFWLGSNSKIIIEKLENLGVGEKLKLSSIFVSAKNQLNNYIENFALSLSFGIVGLHFWVWMNSASIQENIYYYLINIIARNIIGLCLAALMIGSIILLGKLKIRSTFLNFLGEISFELYLVHGTLLSLFSVISGVDFAVTFFIYFILVCISGIALRKFSSFVSDSLLRSLSE